MWPKRESLGKVFIYSMKTLNEKFQKIIDCGDFIPERQKVCCGENGCDPYTGHVVKGNTAYECPDLKRKRIASYWNDKPPFRLDHPDIKQTVSMIAIRRHFPAFLDDAPISLILLGGNGVGKTYAVNCLLHELDWRSVRWYKCQWDFLRSKFKQGYKGIEAFEDILRHICTVKLLFIDDCGIDYNEKDHEIMRRIVVDCWNKRHLILAANMNRKEFSDWLPNMAKSRLNPSGQSTLVVDSFNPKDDLRQGVNQ